jgi:hypothetical protein
LRHIRRAILQNLALRCAGAACHGLDLRVAAFQAEVETGASGVGSTAVTAIAKRAERRRRAEEVCYFEAAWDVPATPTPGKVVEAAHTHAPVRRVHMNEVPFYKH